MNCARPWTPEPPAPPATDSSRHAGRGAAAAKTALRMDGPVTEAAYRNGAIHAGAHLRLTLQGPEDAACAPFLRTLVQLLETPVLLLSA